MADQYTHHQWAKKHMEALCCQIGPRPTGSRANRAATEYIGKHVADCGFDLKMQEFSCMGWVSGRSFLQAGDAIFPIQASPYSLGCKLRLPLEAADCLQALKDKHMQDKILVLHGSLASQPLMPKNFPFYNPKEHKNIIGILEEKKPAAIIALTSKSPQTAGALDPFALFEDGDFSIPSAYLSEKKGAGLFKHIGKKAKLAICSKRIASAACNVVGRKNRGDRRIIFCAHLDTKPNTPGALDNAAGITVLLVLARMLQTHTGTMTVELAFLNGEDYYAAKGHLLYLKEVIKTKESICAACNVDGVGHKAGGTGYALFGFNENNQRKIKHIFDRTGHFRQMEPWFQGDHMLFYQENIPAAAFTSQNLNYIMSEIVHTPNDRIDQVDCRKLTRLAGLFKDLCSRNVCWASKNR